MLHIVLVVSLNSSQFCWTLWTNPQRTWMIWKVECIPVMKINKVEMKVKGLGILTVESTYFVGDQCFWLLWVTLVHEVTFP